MADQHLIAPPLELVHQWVDKLSHCSDQAVFSLAAQWGADQELEACCEWTHDWYGNGSGEVVGNLRAARRPKPPSLKEQALEQLGSIQTDLNKFGMGISTDTIRRALEQL